MLRAVRRVTDSATITSRFWLPTWRWFASAGIAAALIAVSPTLGAACLVAALIMFAVDATTVRSIGAPDVILDVEVRCGLGEERTARLSLLHHTARPMRVSVVVDIPEGLLDESNGSAIDPQHVVLAPSDPTTLPIPLVARKRGEHVVGPVHLRVLGVLGLVSWQARVDAEASIEVIPGLIEAGAARNLVWNRQRRRSGLRAVRQRGDNGQFESLRSYVRGDDPRRIDWKATARRFRCNNA